MYFLAGLLADITAPDLKPVGYVEQGMGIEGLNRRCGEHYYDQS